MAAMAGALGVTLAKSGAYRLGDGAPPVATDIARALRVLFTATALSLLVLIVAAWIVGRIALQSQ